MNETNSIREKLDYEKPCLLEMDLGGPSIVAGTSPYDALNRESVPMNTKGVQAGDASLNGMAGDCCPLVMAHRLILTHACCAALKHGACLAA